MNQVECSGLESRITMNRAIILIMVLSLCCSFGVHSEADGLSIKQLRSLYAQPQAMWPEILTADEQLAQQLAPLELLNDAPDPMRVLLGKRLFHDPQLSRDKTVSCASCHEPRLNFTDKRKVAIGINAQEGTRNTPAIFGLDHWQSFFWDGRANSALEQALMPIKNPIEMDLSVSKALVRINKDRAYAQIIRSAFGTKKLSERQLAQALVAFQRTLLPPDSVFGSYIKRVQSNPKDAITLLTDAQLRGMHLFRTKAKCMTCHEGALLSDNDFHITGLHFFGRKFEDFGRFDATQKIEHIGQFRTPSLLGINKTGPWMHNGLFPSLNGVVNFYNAGGARPKPRKEFADDPRFPVTTELLPKLQLTPQERTDLVAFLAIL